MDYAGLYGGGAKINIPTDKWKSPSNVPSDVDTGVSVERRRPFKNLFGGLREKLGDMFGRNRGRFDSADFDVSNPNEVLKFQRMVGLEQDGVFGPKTQMAYRKFVDQDRMSKGLDAYTYDDGTTFDAYGDGISEPSEEELLSMDQETPLTVAMDNQTGSNWYNPPEQPVDWKPASNNPY